MDPCRGRGGTSLWLGIALQGFVVKCFKGALTENQHLKIWKVNRQESTFEKIKWFSRISIFKYFQNFWRWRQTQTSNIHILKMFSKTFCWLVKELPKYFCFTRKGKFSLLADKLFCQNVFWIFWTKMLLLLARNLHFSLLPSEKYNYTTTEQELSYTFLAFHTVNPMPSSTSTIH